MISTTQQITDIKSEFEGGISFSIDWYSILRRGAKKMIKKINPETLKRVQPIYAGLSRSLYMFYCPSDVFVPSAIYGNDGIRQYDYVPSKVFHQNEDQKKFTIEYINGARFIVIRHADQRASFEIDAMDAIGTKTGDVTLALNTFNYIQGSGSIQASFTDAGGYFGDSFTAPIDITSYLEGLVLIPFYSTTVEDVASVEFRLETDATNYYTVTSTADSIGDYFKDGWNLARFSLQNATTQGSPDKTSIASWKCYITMKSGKTQTIVVDRITMQLATQFYVEYYSNRVFIDGTTNAWKETPVSGDSINLAEEAAEIFHYECCKLVVQAATYNSVDRLEGFSFKEELRDAYRAYYARFPSSEEPLSYSILPDIELNIEPAAPKGELVDYVGAPPDIYPQLARTSSNETPTGAIDGGNTTYTLAYAPSPTSSLMLYLNGVLQVQGVDYTLSGNVITMTTAIPAGYASLPFVAFYNYVD